MTIENRTSKGDVFRRIAITTRGHVPPGQDELKFSTAWFSKDGNTVGFTEPSTVVIQLLVDPGMPVGLVYTLEDCADHCLLVIVEELAVDVMFRNVPIVGDAGTQ
jgi:hypothetical protein